MREEDGIQSDEREDGCDAGSRVNHGELVAAVNGLAVKGDEGGDSGGINALDVVQIEGDIVASEDGSNALEEALLLTANQSVWFARRHQDGLLRTRKVVVHRHTSWKRRAVPVAEVARHVGAGALFCETEARAKRLKEIFPHLPLAEHDRLAESAL